MKKLLSLVLALALVMVCCAFASAETVDLTGKKVALCTATATHGFNSELIIHAQNELKKLAEKYGFEYNLVTSADSVAQMNALETLKTENYDLICVSAVVGDDIANICNEIIESGTKLFVFSRGVAGAQCPLYWGNQYGMGATQGEYVVSKFQEDLDAGKTVEILLFYGDDSINCQERTRGLTETLEAAGITVNQTFRGEWSRQTSMELMENWLMAAATKDISNIRAIVTQDDEISYGIMDAIETYTGSVDLSNLDLLVSIGAQKNYLSKVEDYANTYGIALAGLDYAPTYCIEAIDLAVSWLAGEVELEPGEITFIPDMIDAANMAEYMESETYKLRYSIVDDEGNIIQ